MTEAEFNELDKIDSESYEKGLKAGYENHKEDLELIQDKLNKQKEINKSLVDEVESYKEALHKVEDLVHQMINDLAIL